MQEEPGLKPGDPARLRLDRPFPLRTPSGGSPALTPFVPIRFRRHRMECENRAFVFWDRRPHGICRVYLPESLIDRSLARSMTSRRRGVLVAAAQTGVAASRTSLSLPARELHQSASADTQGGRCGHCQPQKQQSSPARRSHRPPPGPDNGSSCYTASPHHRPPKGGKDKSLRRHGDRVRLWIGKPVTSRRRN